jgi:hypothetical protein
LWTVDKEVLRHLLLQRDVSHRHRHRQQSVDQLLKYPMEKPSRQKQLGKTWEMLQLFDRCLDK